MYGFHLVTSMHTWDSVSSVVSMAFSSSRSRRRFFCPVDMKSTILQRHRFKTFCIRFDSFSSRFDSRKEPFGFFFIDFGERLLASCGPALSIIFLDTCRSCSNCSRASRFSTSYDLNLQNIDHRLIISYHFYDVPASTLCFLALSISFKPRV